MGHKTANDNVLDAIPLKLFGKTCVCKSIRRGFGNDQLTWPGSALRTKYAAGRRLEKITKPTFIARMHNRYSQFRGTGAKLYNFAQSFIDAA
ncbi:MAG: hypothetical protein ABJF28_20095 [Nisaea sp.]|uniref:hypothetical protein n=1 Tax=Alphaproteobacteria TaxID=28211 RepID=UPI0032662CE4